MRHTGLAGDYRFGRFLVYPQWQFRGGPGEQALTARLPVAVHIGPADPGDRWRRERLADRFYAVLGCRW